MILSTVFIALLLIIDRFTKVVLAGWLQGNGSVELIPGVLGLRYLEGGNTGAAFGLFSNSTVLLSVLTGIILLVLIYIVYVRKLHSRLLHTAMLLIIAGGIGNLYDRIVHGFVTDFIEFLFIEFPVFNIADCCITIGAALMILYLIVSKKDDPIFAVRSADQKSSDDGEE